jgi:hypothetical protein
MSYVVMANVIAKVFALSKDAKNYLEKYNVETTKAKPAGVLCGPDVPLAPLFYRKARPLNLVEP